MRPRFFSLLGVGLFLLLSPPGPRSAAAQVPEAPAPPLPPLADRTERFGFALLGGPSLLLVAFGSQSSGSEDVENPGLQLKTGATIGAAWFYGFNPHATLEFDFTKSGVTGRIPAFNFGTTTHPRRYDIDIEVNVTGLSGDLQYGYPFGPFYPYLRLGMGYFFSDFSLTFTSLSSGNVSSAEGKDRSIGYLVGTGFDLTLDPALRFGVDARFNVTFPEGITIAAISIFPRLLVTF
ncbi:MAG: hypothetical protein D6812_00520 [Deltaproteobacteria bacterium]|nr:MAG: hypothetical protein D6812_00520 [Deltaproteobacteria bacterium]